MKQNKLISFLKEPAVIVGVFFIFLILMSGGVSAETNFLGEVQQGKCITLVQTSSSATFANITQITHQPTTTKFLSLDIGMTPNGNDRWTYDFCNTTLIGSYLVEGTGDDTQESTFNYTFNVQGGNLGFYIVAFVIFFGLVFYGMKIKNEWVSLIGCFGLAILGIYTSFNGVGAYKNELTTAISYVTIAISLGIGFQALREITYY